MRKFLAAIVLGGFIAMGLGIGSSYAGKIDILLQKLVEKGILNSSEAQQVRTILYIWQIFLAIPESTWNIQK